MDRVFQGESLVMDDISLTYWIETEGPKRPTSHFHIPRFATMPVGSRGLFLCLS